MKKLTKQELIVIRELGHWTCAECGMTYGSFPKNHFATWHAGCCDVCKKDANVTEFRDFNYLRKRNED